MNTQKLLSVIALALASVNLTAQVNDTYTDTRDSKTYSTVKVGDQTWMSKNYNYSADCSFSYNYSADNASKYGRLYAIETAWRTAPAGWHLPLKSEVFDLVKSLGGEVQEVIDTATIGYGPDVKLYKILNVYDKMVSSLGLKAGGLLYEDDDKKFRDCGVMGDYWLQSTSKWSAWVLNIDFSKKEICVYWLNDYDQQDCVGGYGGWRHSALFVMDYNSSSLYWNLGWAAYEVWDDLDKAIEYSKKCIAIDPTLGMVYANLGLFYMIKGDVAHTRENYNSAILYIGKNPEDAKLLYDAAITDINDAKRKYPSMTGTVEMIKKLQTEADKF